MGSKATAKRKSKAPSETSLTQFVCVPLDWLKPALINDKVYDPVDPKDPEIIDLAEGMKELGWIGGAIAVTTDWVIVSGHRRFVAAQLAGLTEVNVEKLDFSSSDPLFTKKLVTFNKQRKKNPQQEIREAVALTDTGEAYGRLIAHRDAESSKVHKQATDAGLRLLTPSATRTRAVISPDKQPMLAAALGLITKYREFWPLTLRQIHYRMLPLNVFRNAGNEESKYINDRASYQDLSKLLVRARHDGSVSFDAIVDETRPQTSWSVWNGVGVFVREQVDDFLRGYRRDFQQSQPAYVLLFVEKMTVQAIAERAAMKYVVPVAVGRGYPSFTAVHEMAQHFRASGKDRMILLMATDFDPEGENIADRLTASLRDEFGITDITAAKVALTKKQVAEMQLPPMLEVKDKSSRAKGFVEEHGRTVYELEAIEPATLQAIIGRAIESVLDMNLFRQEQANEAEDARQLEARRKVALDAIAGL